ncbi:unnamed protein product [Orchesella dallaii]|uniref:Cyclic nucleotide-binding domain-containing protein n=1 Tax=Orchesella dallaii TaxID=48710 RepID=A0ABP1S9M5_9HEXA
MDIIASLPFIIEKIMDSNRAQFEHLSQSVVTTISTTGFGDIVPVTIKEMAVGIFCIFCGAFILSMILSQFTSGMGSLTRTKREYMYQVLLLLVPYFQDTQEKIFIRQLSSRVTHSFYIPGTFVQYEGDIGTSLFVVYKGLVSGTQKLKNVKKGELDTELKEIFNPGDAFGRSAALFHDGLYKQSYRAETMVEILEVKQKDIVHLAQKFPRIKKRILNYINSKYGDRRDVGTNIFQRKRRKAEAFGPGADILFMTATRSQRVFPKLEEEPEDEYPNPLKKYEPAPPTPPPPPPKMFDQMVQVDLPPDRNKKRKSKDHEESKVNPIRRNPVAIPPPEKSNQTISEDDNASSRSSSTSTSESPTFKKSMQNDEVAYRRSSNVTPKRASKDVTRGKKYETKRNSRDVDNGIGTRKPRHSNESKKDKRRSSDDSKKNKRRPSNDNKQDKRRPSDDNKQYKRRPSDDNKQYKRRPSDDNKQEKRRSSNDNKQDKRRPSDDNKQGNRRRSSEGSDQPRRGSRRRSSTKKRRSSGGTDDEPRRRRRSSQRKSVDENNKQDGEWWPWF